MKSIISNHKVCFVCNDTNAIHKHHIFYGPNRRNSDKEGCWVYLCAKHHNMSNEGVHFNKEFDLYLKKFCQATWEMENGSREEFRKIFGKSYL